MVIGEMLGPILAILICIVVVTQFIVPLWNNKPVFPVFRKRGKVEEKVMEVMEDLEEVKLEKMAQGIQQKVDKVKQGMNDGK